MKATKKLIMWFLTSDNKKISLWVENPIKNITENEIKSSMDLVSKKIYLFQIKQI